MSKNAMAGAVTLCGVGLCLIGGASVMQNGQQAHAAAGSMSAAAAAVAATANARAGPTVVWYGVSSPSNYYAVTGPILFRAWSDGTIEYKALQPNNQVSPCDPNYSMCISEWRILSSPAQGYRAAADINADEAVDGVDVASVLSNWGDAPRVPFPPSDCPLNLINP